MDLKRLCEFRVINLFLFILSINNGFVRSEHECAKGISGFLGYTLPKGDIFVEYGQDLDISCVLFENSVEKYQLPVNNASSYLMFRRNNEILPEDMIEIINSTSIRLHIEDPPKVSRDHYTCHFKNDSTVCMNTVTVGVKPQPVTDFDCVGYNYLSLICTWTPPENYADTRYNLTFRLVGRAGRIGSNCLHMKLPDLNNGETKIACFWNVSTTPHYRQVHEDYYFNLRMKNYFGTNELNTTFKHFQHVLSDPPENLTAVNATSSSIFLYWKVPQPMESFPKGVNGRILYQCEYGDKKWHLGGFTSKNTTYFNLTDLPYAHALFDIRVALRSTVAIEERMWSKNSSITVRTSPNIPDGPPVTQMGSFEVSAARNNIQYRDVYVYWQQLHEYQKNGPDFKYEIYVEGNSSQRPIEKANGYAKFKDLLISRNYRFYIWSENAVGRSHARSTVYVPKQIERIGDPLNFVKVEYGDGRYELSWDPPLLMPGQVITNYTIFKCLNDRERPYQCTGQLNWTIVPSDIFKHNDTVEQKNKIYQFAISANTHNSSSGMLWAACTVLHNQNVGKMKNVWINRLGSTFIHVGWKLDCSDQIGSVDGFLIYYCPIISPSQLDCKGPQKNVTFRGSNINDGNVEDLTPYTTYMLTVSAITKHGTYSQASDQLLNTTLEAAPSSPPQNFSVTDVTNSSVSLAWDPPIANNGILKYYSIEYNGMSVKKDPHVNAATLENLRSFEHYSISIKACTISCSDMSKLLHVTTKMGAPGEIFQPTIKFQNDANITVSWNKPLEPNGRNDYYEVRIKEKYQNENISIPVFNVTASQYTIDNCGDSGKYNTFYVAVRAVNIIENKPHPGNWSDELESYCRTPGNYMMYVILPVLIIAILAAVMLFRRVYQRYKIMISVEVKLPPGLAVIDDTFGSIEKRPAEGRESHSPPDEELLLVKMTEGRRSGDSSGCSSGNESVTSSLESGTHISSTSDSGTEQPANYFVLGVNPKAKAAAEAAAVAASVTVSQSSYIPFNHICTPSDSSTEQPSSYCVLGVNPKAAAAAITMNSSYVPVAANPNFL